MRVHQFVHLGLGWIGDQGGGLERYQHGICSAHANMGLDVEAWVQSRCLPGSGIPYSVNVFASPNESRIRRIRQLKRLAIPRFQDGDLTFVSHHASVSAPLVPYLGDIPHVVHFQGPWAEESLIEGVPHWKAWLQKRFEKTAYSSADCIITLSEAFANIACERYRVDRDRIRIIPGGIDSEKANPGLSRSEARECLGWPSGRPIILSVRRLVRRVGIDILISAARQLIRRHPELLILIGGTGPLRNEFQTQIDELGIEKNVRLLGFIPERDLPVAYAGADYSIVPTQSLEGFGLVTIESMAAGTPAIVTPVGSLPEIASPLSRNLVLEGCGEQAMVSGLSRILKGEVSIPNADSCIGYVRNNYDWRVISPKVLSVYRSV